MCMPIMISFDQCAGLRSASGPRVKREGKQRCREILNSGPQETPFLWAKSNIWAEDHQTRGSFANEKG